MIHRVFVWLTCACCDDAQSVCVTDLCMLWWCTECLYDWLMHVVMIHRVFVWLVHVVMMYRVFVWLTCACCDDAQSVCMTDLCMLWWCTEQRKAESWHWAYITVVHSWSSYWPLSRPPELLHHPWNDVCSRGLFTCIGKWRTRIRETRKSLSRWKVQNWKMLGQTTALENAILHPSFSPLLFSSFTFS